MYKNGSSICEIHKPQVEILKSQINQSEWEIVLKNSKFRPKKELLPTKIMSNTRGKERASGPPIPNYDDRLTSQSLTR